MAAALLTLATLMAVASVVLAALHARRVSQVLLVDAALVAALKRVSVERRLEELARRTPERSWAHRFAIEVGEATTEGARAAAANEVLGDLGYELEATASWPGAAVRLACFGALLLAVAGFLLSARSAILPTLGIGVTGALVAFELGRRARSAAAARRAAADALVDATLPDASARVSSREGTFRRARRQ